MNEWNNWYLRGLSKLDEPALEIWAKAENIEEAYRFLAFPTFSSAELIRVYRSAEHFYLVRKLASRGFGRLLKQAEYELGVGDWTRLKAFLDEYFWTTETWSGQPVIDGVIMVFEAWKDGNYGSRFDHSIGQDRLASKAGKLFKQIYTESKKS